MMSGSPPTKRNARTGLFTPPTSTLSARSKISRERLRSRFNLGCVALMLFSIKLSRLQPACDVLGVVGQQDIRSRAPNPGENLQHHALFIQPAVLRSGFHHGVFSAHVVRSDRNIKL